ncbi:MAG: hypothetical protein RL609_1469 [Bacteroidota bacterium]|jgi:hypothetical protein
MEKLFRICIAIVSASAIIMACGDRSNVDEKKCSCSSISKISSMDKYFKDGVEFTGICEDLDQNNFVISHKEFTNGYLTYWLQKKKINSGYVTVDSIYYDNNNAIAGFGIEIISNGFGTYVEKVYEYSKEGMKTGSIHLMISEPQSVEVAGEYMTIPGRTNCSANWDKQSVELEKEENMDNGKFMEEVINKATRLNKRFLKYK